MNKMKNPAGFQPKVAPAPVLTEEQKKAKIMQFLQQKREGFAINILCNLCQAASPKVVATMDSTKLTLDTTGLVDKAVEMADKLIEKLYPLPEETDKANE